MSSKTTKVIGYYNGNRWPIQLVISKLNITLVLKENEFILDRATGQKINDPYFDIYVQNKQLMREEGDTDLPIIAIPVVTPNTPARDGNAVRSVTQFKEVRGVRTPVLQTAQPEVQQPLAHHASHIGMSVEEARRLGFIRKTREVPEDYGTPDSPDTPPRNIPPIRYATDTTRTKPTELPKELTEAIASEPKAAPLVQQLAKAAATAPVVESPFANTSIPAAAEAQSPLVSGKPTGAAVPMPVRPVARPAAQEDEARDEEPPEEESVLPPPQLEGDNMIGVPEPVVEEESVTEPVEELPPPLPRGAKKVNPITPDNKFVCLACGKGFPFRSKLEQHAHQSHPQSVVHILSQYPKT
jgi:hypothetical protein